MKQFTELGMEKTIPVLIPNLPTAPVKVVIAAGDISGLNFALNRFSIIVLNTLKSLFLEKGLANHADLLVYHLGSDEILIDAEQTFSNKYNSNKSIKFKRVSKRIESPYPSDVYLNAARLGKFLICNMKTIAPEILQDAKEKGLEIISVKQGYTKCSVCVINENTIITEDIGIGRACTNKGIDVLVIGKGSIKLRDHNYGFIGGCTGLIDKNKLAFVGDYRKHTDCRKIEAYLTKHNIEPVSLLEDELIDIGGIIPILQEND